MEHLGNVTFQVAKATTPLRGYYAERYPNLRAVTAAANTDVTTRELRVPPPAEAQRYGGGVGTAFDLALRMRFDPEHQPIIVVAGMPSPRAIAVACDVITAASQAARDSDAVTLARACWAMARCVDAARIGFDEVGDLVRLRQAGQFTPDGLLGLADETAIEQITALLRVFDERAPFAGVRAIGPILGNRWIQADADLITDDGVLIDLKTSAGTKRPDGSRRCPTKNTEILQVITYALLDVEDRYEITGVGLYSARWGTYTTWEADNLLASLAGSPTNLETERQAFWGWLSA